MNFSRRRLLQAGAFLAGAAPLAAFASLNPDKSGISAVVEKVDVQIPDLPREFENYRIGFLTDIHAGACVAGKALSESLELLAAADIDLLLLGGDYIWNTESFIPQAALSISTTRDCFVSNAIHADEIYASLAGSISSVPVRDGIFAVLGNHDGWVNAEFCKHQFSSRDIRVLVNDYHEIYRGSAKLTLYGADDYWTGMPRAPQRFNEIRGNKSNQCRLVLTHNPDFAADLLDHQIADFDFALAGHTHGGQIKLPGIGALFYNVRDQRFTEGLQLGARIPVYTSRGTGTVLMPVRLNCPPEVTVIRLVSV